MPRAPEQEARARIDAQLADCGWLVQDFRQADFSGRGKDKARLRQFIEEDALDTTCFLKIVRRYDLVDAWTKFERQFLAGTP